MVAAPTWGEASDRPAAVGGSANVQANAETVVDPPTRLADEMSAERPPSGQLGGGSTIVRAGRWWIDHRPCGPVVDRPSSVRADCGPIAGRLRADCGPIAGWSRVGRGSATSDKDRRGVRACRAPDNGCASKDADRAVENEHAAGTPLVLIEESPWPVPRSPFAW